MLEISVVVSAAIMPGEGGGLRQGERGETGVISVLKLSAC